LQKLLSPEVWPYLILPIVLAVSQFIMTRMSQASQPTTGDPQDSSTRMMGQMTILMTGMFVLFSLQVPAGMSLYWVVGNLLAMAQQYYVNRQKDQWDAATVTSMPARSTSVTTDVSGEVVAISANGTFSADSSSTAMSDSASSVRRKRRKRR
jgi:YidC/Oxa1 family membrane protein insertase